MRLDLHSDFPPMKSWVKPEHRSAYRLLWWGIIVVGFVVIIIGARPAYSGCPDTQLQVVVKAHK